MRPIVYLAGGMTGLIAEHALAWREFARLALKERGVETLSPMRGHPAEGKTGRFKSSAVIRLEAYDDVMEVGGIHGIMLRDFTDVKRADAILVNLLDAPSISVGTAMELAWAYAMQKPTVIAIEPEGNPHDRHPMVCAAMSYRLTSLDDAIDAVAVVLGR